MSKLYISLILILLAAYGNLFAQGINQDISVTTDSAKQIQEIVLTTNGVTYSFKSDKIIDFSNKSNVVFPEGTTASLIETRNNKSIEAELRVKNDDYQLYFVREGDLSIYYKNEDDWLKQFLNKIIKSQTLVNSNSKNTASASHIKSDSLIYKEIELKTESENSIDIFLNTLKNLNLEANKFELLSNKIEKGIGIKEQKKVIGFIFGNFNIEDNKVKLLNQLIDSPHYSKENNDYLISFIDQLHIESNKVNLLKKLMR